MSSLYSSDANDRPPLGSLLGKSVAWALLFALTVLIGVAGLVPQLLGAVTQPMRTDAMEPVISKGDLVVSEPVELSALKPGDIITFRPPGGAPSLTRTVVAVEPIEAALPDESSPSAAESSTAIVTTGDASVREYRIAPGQVIGRVAYHLPLVGILSTEQRGWWSSPLILLLAGGIVLALLLHRRSQRRASES
jgi:signal peptidase I